MENETLKLRKELTLEAFNLPLKILVNSNVKKIIQANVRSVANAEDNNGLVTLTGKTYANIVYLNTENVLENAETVIDFAEKQKIEAKFSNLRAEIAVFLTDLEFSNGEIYANAKHNAKLSGIVEFNLPVANLLEEEYVCKKKDFKAQTISSVVTDSFVIAEENDSNLKDLKVLNSTATVQVNEVTSGVDKVIVDGVVFVEVLYADAENIGSINKSIEFKQEISAERVLPNQMSIAEMTVKNVTVSPEEKDGKVTLVYAIDMQAYVCIYDNFEIELIGDVFSLKNELTTKHDYIEFKEFLSAQENDFNLVSQTDISGVTEFDDLICVENPSFEVFEISREEGKFVVNGKFDATAIYRDSQGINSLKVSTPQMFEIETEQAENLVAKNIIVQIVSSKVKAGKELEVAFKLICKFEGEKVVGEDYVKTFEIIDVKPEDDFGVKVYVTKAGQTVYEVAKILNVRPEQILEQNKEIDNVFESGQKVYVYLPINL